MNDKNIIQKGLVNSLNSSINVDSDTGFITMPVWNYNSGNYYKGFEIEKGYNCNDVIYSVVSKIAKTISNNLVWKVRAIKPNGDIEEVKDSALNNLLEDPNQYETIQEFREKAISYLLLSGINYIFGSNGSTAQGLGFNSIHVLPSQSVNIKQGTLSDPIKSIEVDWKLSKEIKKEDVFITRYPSLSVDNYFGGHSPLMSGFKLTETVNSVINAHKSIMENRGVSGALSNDSDQIMLPNDQDELQKNLNKQLNGSDKMGGIFATGANLKYLKFDLSPQDLKLIESYEALLRRVCNLFNIDSKLFGDTSSSTFNNMKEATKSAFLNCFIPNDSKILATFNKGISSRYSDGLTKYEVYHDLSGVDALQEDKNEKQKVIEKQSKEVRAIITDINNGMLSVDAGVLMLTDIHGIEEDKAEILAQYGQAKDNGQSEEVQSEE